MAEHQTAQERMAQERIAQQRTAEQRAGENEAQDEAQTDASMERLQQLREEAARLEATLGVAPVVSTPAAPAGGTSGRGGWWRTPVVVVCVLLSGLLAPLAIVATWAHDVVSDTDRYVATVAPLADDPAVQRAVSSRITAQLLSYLDIRGVTSDAVDALAARGVPENVATSLRALGTPLANSIESFVSQRVTRLVQSEEFANAWTQANREAHGQMVGILTGEGSEAVAVEGNTVKLNLAVVVDAVKQRLINSGFALAERIPEVQAQFTLFESADLARVQTGFRVLSALARALPVLAVLLLAVAVAVARRRRRTLVVGSLVIAGSMLLLGLVLNAFRVVYLDAVPSSQLPADAAAAVYDQLVWFIRLNLRAVLVLFLAIAVVAWVSGPEPAPVALRAGVTRGLDVVRHGSDRAGLDTGPVGEFLARYRVPIRGLVAGVVVLVYVLADHPTGGWTLGLLLSAALLLLVVELLARDPAPPHEGLPESGSLGA